MTHKCVSVIISKTFNDYDNDYYTCNKITQHFHNQTHAHTHTHNLNCRFYLSLLSTQNYIQCDQAHTKLERIKKAKWNGWTTIHIVQHFPFASLVLSWSGIHSLACTHTHALRHIPRTIDISHLPLLIKRNRSNPRSCEHLARSTCKYKWYMFSLSQWISLFYQKKSKTNRKRKRRRLKEKKEVKKSYMISVHPSNEITKNIATHAMPMLSNEMVPWNGLPPNCVQFV